MQASGNQAGEVGHINPQHSTDLVGNFAECCKVQVTRVSRPSRNQHLRAFTQCSLANFLGFNTHRLWIDLIANCMIVLARKVQAHTVSEVTSVRQGQAQKRITNVCHCHECCSICLGT